MGVRVVTKHFEIGVGDVGDKTDLIFPGLGPASEIKGVMIVSTRFANALMNIHHFDRSWSAGFFDGTNHRMMCWGYEDNQTSVNCVSRGTTDSISMSFLANLSGAINHEVNVDSFITDGVRLNTITDPLGVLQLSVTVWAGTDVSCEVGDFTPNAVVGNTTVETVGFEFDHMIAIGAGRSDFTDSQNNFWMPNMGFCDNAGGGSFTQGCMVIADNDGGAAVQAQGEIRTARVSASIDNEAEDMSVEITAATATNFTATTRDNGLASQEVAYMIISYGGVARHWVDNDQSSPTSDGDHDVTDVGFTPQYVLKVQGMMTVIDSMRTDATAGSFGIGAFGIDGYPSTSYISIALEDGSDPPNQSQAQYTDGHFSRVANDDQTIAFLSPILSTTPFFDLMLTNGYRLNYTATDSTARHWIALAVEAQGVYEQEGMQWREDDGSESGATFIGSQDQELLVRDKNITARLRVTNNAFGADPDTAQVALQYRQKGDPDSEWRDVP